MGNATNKLFTGFIKNKRFPKTNHFSRNFPEIRLRLKVNYQLNKEKIKGGKKLDPITKVNPNL